MRATLFLLLWIPLISATKPYEIVTIARHHCFSAFTRLFKDVLHYPHPGRICLNPQAITVHAIEIMRQAQKEGGIMQVACIDDQFIGAVYASRLKNKFVQTNVIVSPWYRRQGVGKSLLTSLLHHVEQQENITQVEAGPLHNYHSAIPLYKSLGFKEKKQLQVLDHAMYEDFVSLIWTKKDQLKK